jgi:hypothetical protein
MQKAADLALLVQLGALFFYPANQHHLPVEAQIIRFLH